ncbi:MAG TPA: hypothetical protein VNZ52_03640 [Candidatus Thermoplasmatota archaeon]|nr:hypothetical protein [Candidatus Thermoplasmatota archaeon]
MAPGNPGVDPAVLNRLPTPISACSQCASLNVRAPEVRDGAIPSTALTFMVCLNCGNRGQPLLFNTAPEYAAFANDIVRVRRG